MKPVSALNAPIIPTAICDAKDTLALKNSINSLAVQAGQFNHFNQKPAIIRTMI